MLINNLDRPLIHTRLTSRLILDWHLNWHLIGILIDILIDTWLASCIDTWLRCRSILSWRLIIKHLNQYSIDSWSTFVWLLTNSYILIHTFLQKLVDSRLTADSQVLIEVQSRVFIEGRHSVEKAFRTYDPLSQMANLGSKYLMEWELQEKKKQMLLKSKTFFGLFVKSSFPTNTC